MVQPFELNPRLRKNQGGERTGKELPNRFWSGVNKDLSPGEQAILDTLEHVALIVLKPPKIYAEFSLPSMRRELIQFGNPVYVLNVFLVAERQKSDRSVSLVSQLVALLQESNCLVESPKSETGLRVQRTNWGALLEQSDADFAASMQTPLRRVMGKEGVPWGEEQEKMAQSVAEDAARESRALRAGNFPHQLDELVNHGLPLSAKFSDDGLRVAQDAFKAVVLVFSALAKIALPPRSLEALLKKHGYDAVETMGLEALHAFNARCEEARDQERAAEEQRAIRRETRAQLEAAKQLLEDTRRAERQEIRAQEEREARELSLRAFHSTFQRVDMPAELLTAIAQLQTSSSIPHNSREACISCATKIVQVMHDVRDNVLDRRGDCPRLKGDPNIQKLANLLLSKDVIGTLTWPLEPSAVANVLGIKTPLSNTFESRAEKLFELYSTSGAARRIILSLLDQREGIALLAVITRPRAEVCSYVSKWMKEHKTQRVVGLPEPSHEWDASYQKLRYEIVRTLENQAIVSQKRLAPHHEDDARRSTRATPDIPDWVYTGIETSKFLVWATPGNISFALREFPEVRFALPSKMLNDKETFTRECKKQIALCLQLENVEALVRDLVNGRGFSLVLEADRPESPPIIRHPNYELEAVLLNDRSHWGGKLRELKALHQEIDTRWISLTHELCKTGFEVSTTSEEMVIKHPLLQEQCHLAIPWTPISRIEEVERLLQRGVHATAEHQSRIARQREREARRAAKIETEIMPQFGDEVVILDNTVLSLLGVSRSSGAGTWLELITVLSELPNVRIMVPSCIADFEASGKIFPYEDEEPTWIDGRPDDLVAAVAEFFKSAARMQLQGDRSLPRVKNPYNTTPRISIVETPSDTEIYNHLRQIVMETGGNTFRRVRELHEKVYHHGLGETSIEQLISAAPFTNNFTVVTDDLRWSKNELPRRIGGKVVSTCTTGALLKSILKFRNYGPFANFSWGGATFDDICRDAEIRNNSHGKQPGPLRLSPYWHKGAAEEGSPSPIHSIHEIIERGVRAWGA